MASVLEIGDWNYSPGGSIYFFMCVRDVRGCEPTWNSLNIIVQHVKIPYMANRFQYILWHFQSLHIVSLMARGNEMSPQSVEQSLPIHQYDLWVAWYGVLYHRPGHEKHWVKPDRMNAGIYQLLNSRNSIDPNFDNNNGHTIKSLSYICRTQKTVNIEYRDELFVFSINCNPYFHVSVP